MAGASTEKPEADKVSALAKDPAKEPAKDEKEAAPAVVTLEEDDEFEDFPAEDWPDAEAEVAIPGGKEHLWEENWDDDDADDDFSNQLREELRKTSVSK